MISQPTFRIKKFKNKLKVNNEISINQSEVKLALLQQWCGLKSKPPNHDIGAAKTNGPSITFDGRNSNILNGNGVAATFREKLARAKASKRGQLSTQKTEISRKNQILMERPFFLDPADPKNFELQYPSDEEDNPRPDGSYSVGDTSADFQHPTFNINISPDTDIYGRLETVVNRISTKLQSTSRRIRNSNPNNDRRNIAKTSTGLPAQSTSFYSANFSGIDDRRQQPGRHLDVSNNQSHNSISGYLAPSNPTNPTSRASDLYRHSPLTQTNISAHFEKVVSKFQTNFFSDLEKKKASHTPGLGALSRDISFDGLTDINKYLASTKHSGGNVREISFRKNKQIVDEIIIDRHNKVNILKDTMMGDYIESSYKLWQNNDLGVNLIGVQELIGNVKRFNGELKNMHKNLALGNKVESERLIRGFLNGGSGQGQGQGQGGNWFRCKRMQNVFCVLFGPGFTENFFKHAS